MSLETGFGSVKTCVISSSHCFVLTMKDVISELPAVATMSAIFCHAAPP